MAEQCTWDGCSREANETLLDKDGKPWARLCLQCLKDFDDTIKSGNAKHIVAAWIKAQGGSGKATQRVLPLVSKEFIGKMLDTNRKDK